MRRGWLVFLAACGSQTPATGDAGASDAGAVDAAVVDAAVVDAGSLAWAPGNYVLLTSADGATSERDALLASNEMSSFVGIEKRYDWFASEGAEGDYGQGIANIESDLAAVDAVHKKLLLFLTYKIFSAGHAVPSYMLSAGPWCVGSTCGEVSMTNGVTAMIWIPGVADRLHAWIQGMAAELLASPHAGAIAGIVFPETACGGCDTAGTQYTDTTYLAALEANATTVVASFPNTIVFQYINFFPPNKTATQNLVAYADFALATPHVGLGCPDLAPLFSPPEYPILENAKYQGRVPIAPAVESPDYASDRASVDGGVGATYALGIHPAASGGMGAQIISWADSNNSNDVFTLADVASYVAAHPDPNTAIPTW